MNPWIYLSLAIFLEIVGMTLLKASDGFARIGIGAASIACYVVCFAMLAIAITKIPVGVAYAIWSGVGIIAIALIGWLAFKQNLNIIQIACIAMIALGAIGLQMSTPIEHTRTEQAHKSDEISS